LRDDIESCQLRIGPVGAEAGRREVDQPRRIRRERLVADAQIAHRPRAQVLDHDVGRRGEPPKEHRAVGRLEVERDAALVAVEAQKIRALAFDKGAGRAGEVAARGFSTLTTSAPRSASCIPQNGTAMKLPTSTTRIPSSGG